MAQSREPAGQASAPPSGLITVSQLALLIQRTLADHMPAGLKVVGEISQFRDRTHWYFDLKDESAVVSCVMWQSAARKAGFVPAVGQKVVLSGRVDFYQGQGRTQFMADRIEPVGVGALDLAFRKLCDELRALGWFEQERKRPLPMFPRRVAVITSRTGAALQDVIDTVARRCPALSLALVDVRVQGDGAAEQVARAIRAVGASRARLGIDVILVTRGGGSMEDLWAFNDRALAEAIIKSPVPVVAAIGHETDTTIAELVADLRCATPTQAAMRIAPDASGLRDQLHSLGRRLSTNLTRQVRIDAERLRGAARHSFFIDPHRMIDERREDLLGASRDLRRAALQWLHDRSRRLEALSQRIERHRPGAVYASREARLHALESRLRTAAAAAVQRTDLPVLAKDLTRSIRLALDTLAGRLESAARGLDLVGPHSVLKRGYSVTLTPDGSVVRSAAAMSAGQVIQTRLADGSFRSVVAPDGATSVPLRPVQAVRQRPRTRPPVAPDQLDLFDTPS